MTWVRDDVIGRYLDRMFVHSFIEERFAASASHRMSEDYEVVNQAGSVAMRFVDEWWRHPSNELGLRRYG